MMLLPETRLIPETFLGSRVFTTAAWLLQADLEPRLAGYRSKPGSHMFIGEHIGKWIDAASLLVRSTGDVALEDKLRGAVRALIATQEADGYLGTYLPGVRFSSAPDAGWDVWSSKYCLLGLLSFHAATGDADALGAAVRLADRLIVQFGPGRHDILATDMHRGLASGSVLLPIVRLAAVTGEARFLEFARQILDALDSVPGPGLRPTLLSAQGVAEVGNGKAYEMLSCIHGMLELGILVGDEDAQRAAILAWDDIRDRHLYITGTASYGEHFHRSRALPASPEALVGETCVTTTWIQLSLALFEHLGETRFLDEVERSLFNQLAASQSPDASTWCYFLPLQGVRHTTDVLACCSSSGPRGYAVAPSAAFTLADDGALAVGLYQSAEAELVLGGVMTRVRLTSDSPFTEDAELHLDPTGKAEFEVRFRVPGWVDVMTVDGSPVLPDAAGWHVMPSRVWRPGDRVSLGIPAGVRRVAGRGWNAGRSSLAQGPIVLAYRSASAWPAYDAIDSSAPLPDRVKSDAPRAWTIWNAIGSEPVEVELLPFSEAGRDEIPIRTWIFDEPRTDVSLLLGARETLSGGPKPADAGRTGSAVDADQDTARIAVGGCRSDGLYDFIAAEVDEAITVGRIVVRQGLTSVLGGWFDTAHVTPEIQVRRLDSAWETICVLEDYARTNCFDRADVTIGDTFEVLLKEPILILGVRVRGIGSSGYFHQGRQVSISEISAYPR